MFKTSVFAHTKLTKFNEKLHTNMHTCAILCRNVHTFKVFVQSA